jgi:hypothetical protein
MKIESEIKREFSPCSITITFENELELSTFRKMVSYTLSIPAWINENCYDLEEKHLNLMKSILVDLYENSSNLYYEYEASK